VALAGVVLVTGVDVAVGWRVLAGDGLALLGAALCAIYVELAAKARQGMSTLSFTAVCYTVTALLTAAFCFLNQVGLHGYTGRDWLLLATITVGPQLAGHAVLNHVGRTSSRAVVSLCILLEVPGAALLALVWLHQVPTVLILPGLALVGAGVALVLQGSGLHDHAEPAVAQE
jgi:drug/metabolite transporter (DMT)-like permease